MAEPTKAIFPNTARSEWVRLRTLINLRWLAIAGQCVAIAVAFYVLDLELQLGLTVAAIGASVISIWRPRLFCLKTSGYHKGKQC